MKSATSAAPHSQSWPLCDHLIETTILPVLSPLGHHSPPRASSRAFWSAARPAAAQCTPFPPEFVALTRRAGAEFADAGGPRDPTLVRHAYDLHVMRAHYDPSEVAALARTIMLADAKAYGHQIPAYRENPIAETFRATIERSFRAT